MAYLHWKRLNFIQKGQNESRYPQVDIKTGMFAWENTKKVVLFFLFQMASEGYFQFRHFWKLLTPPPPCSNSDFFDFPTFLIKVILQNNCKIIEIGTFLKNRDPPLCFQNSQIEIGTFLGFFYPPPPPIETRSHFFPFFFSDASP